MDTSFMDFSYFVIMFMVALVAGFINVVSGGGGFLSIGALLISGLPPANALATNKIQALGSSLTSGIYFLRRGHINVQEHKYVFLSAFIGSALGTTLIQFIEPELLKKLLPILIIAVAIFSIPAFARLVRGNTLVLKQQTFIESARSMGASDATILFSHILPGTVSSIVVYFTMRIGVSIISAASLSFLGLGAQPPTPEWGAMLNEARADMVIAPHVAIFPSLAIFLTVLAFNLLGDGLRDALDPRIKG